VRLAAFSKAFLGSDPEEPPSASNRCSIAFATSSRSNRFSDEQTLQICCRMRLTKMKQFDTEGVGSSGSLLKKDLRKRPRRTAEYGRDEKGIAAVQIGVVSDVERNDG
jgi:hypothetical protein